MQISNRVAAMPFSPIRKFNPIAAKAKEEGKKIYHLNVGQPDIVTPDCFKKAIFDYSNQVVAYSDSLGVPDLLDSIIDYFKPYGMNYERKNIVITNGGAEALTFVFTALMNAGDEAIVAEPFYANYMTFSGQVDSILKPIPSKAEEGYSWVSKENIEAAITPMTKAICCISPGNPTGKALSLEEMRIVAEVAKAHDLWIISDEVYREFVYDGREVTSFGMLDDVADRVIIIDSVSKRFSACGARIGSVISKNDELMGAILKLAQGRLCSPTLDQIGSAALYRIDRSYYDEMRAEYEARRNAAYEEISKIPGVVCTKPGGAFYLMAKLPVDDIEDFLMFLLTEFEDKGETVMFAPGEGFYMTPGMGKNEIRIAYVLDVDSMRRGAELIALGLEAYKKKTVK